MSSRPGALFLAAIVASCAPPPASAGECENDLQAKPTAVTELEWIGKWRGDDCATILARAQQEEAALADINRLFVATSGGIDSAVRDSVGNAFKCKSRVCKLREDCKALPKRVAAYRNAGNKLGYELAKKLDTGNLADYQKGVKEFQSVGAELAQYDVCLAETQLQQIKESYTYASAALIGRSCYAVKAAEACAPLAREAAAPLAAVLGPEGGQEIEARLIERGELAARSNGAVPPGLADKIRRSIGRSER